ncbi:cytochrome P450 [Zychaea mexicana]|uniref:cytochrome P450 n=1 Tax=Zychaea mexicana TaxID=64656 RepID=UPI0022FF0346|nr:cytochrome P450 [Zychaea mexicana]KAI9495418.1 cytochrome P450 [Zychaea mexicana]
MISSIQNASTTTASTITTYSKAILTPEELKTFVANNKWSIRLATLAMALYLMYGKVTKPPAQLRHIPHLPFHSFFKAHLQQKSAAQIAEETTLPAALASAHGLYLRCDTLGWSVRANRPEIIKVLLMNKYLFPKAAISKENRKGTLYGRTLIGPNVGFSTGDQWKKQRQVLNPAFARSMPVKALGRLSQTMINVIEAQIGADGNELLDLYDIAHRWALDALCVSLLGFDFKALEDRNNPWVTRYKFILSVGSKQRFFAFPFMEQYCWFLFPDIRRAHDVVTIFQNMLRNIVNQKREALLRNKDTFKTSSKAEEQEKDIVTSMVEAEMEGQGRLTDEELQSNFSLFFMVGHESTASTASFAMYYFAKHQDVQQRAREEAIRIFGDGFDIIPTLEQTSKLDYLNMVIKETLRIMPPAVTTIARIATEDTELSGVFIPKGTRVAVDVFELQRNPQVWKNPDVFDPERFAPGGEAEELSKTGLPWVPFSSGSRQCIGLNFSMIELRVLLPMLLRKFEWSVPENSIHKDKLVIEGLGVIRPKNLMLSFKKRY